MLSKYIQKNLNKLELNITTNKLVKIEKLKNKNGIFDDNDNEIANNIAKKVTIPDENKQNKKRNNDTRF